MSEKTDIELKEGDYNYSQPARDSAVSVTNGEETIDEEATQEL